MSLLRFFKDKQPLILVFFIGWAVMVCFFAGFHDSLEQAVIISVLYFASVICALLLEYFLKAGFYKNARASLDRLDKKYLLPEMLDTPSFAEGEICKELLCEAGKSMTEQVSDYKRQSDEFREFIELWVHEVKLPVASLSLMSHNDGEAGAKYSAQLKRLDGLIENVLYYSRSENAQKDYLITEIPLGAAFKGAALSARESLLEKNVTLKTQGLDIKVTTDAKWLEYIFTQLITNSLKYFSPEREPVIEVSAYEDDRAVRLSFKDNGIGIPDTDLPYVFEKTFTGENGRIGAKSTGMGLYIVKSLCKKLGTDITARSFPGEWTEFIITFGKNDLFRL